MYIVCHAPLLGWKQYSWLVLRFETARSVVTVTRGAPWLQPHVNDDLTQLSWEVFIHCVPFTYVFHICQYPSPSRMTPKQFPVVSSLSPDIISLFPVVPPGGFWRAERVLASDSP